jgi:hypothetical protein
VEPSLVAARRIRRFSLSGTATSWPTGRTMGWAGKWCSTG